MCEIDFSGTYDFTFVPRIERYRMLGEAIHAHADSVNCSVVRDFVGHGVGREFHMAPQVPHYRQREIRQRMRAGWVFTIEPMINIGAYHVEMMDDGWTALTADRSLSAQFEHTILVTDHGCEVLTARPEVVTNSEDLSWSQLGKLSTPAAFRP